MGNAVESLDIRSRVPAGVYMLGKDGRRTRDVAATGPPHCLGKGVPHEGAAVAGRLVRSSESLEASARGLPPYTGLPVRDPFPAKVLAHPLLLAPTVEVKNEPSEYKSKINFVAR